MFQCPQCSLPCSESHVPNITIMKYVEVMNEKSEERVRKRGASERESCTCFLAKLMLPCYFQSECLLSRTEVLHW